MSKKGRKPNKTAVKNKAPKSLNYPKILKRVFITLCLLGAIVVLLNVYFKQSKVEHDLSVIGNGKPTLVQIHDPGCRLCQRLQSNVDKVKGEFKDVIQFKIANIAKQKGKRFASKHNVPHVTLLFFDKQGERVNTMQGVSSADEIKSNLKYLSSE